MSTLPRNSRRALGLGAVCGLVAFAALPALAADAPGTASPGPAGQSARPETKAPAAPPGSAAAPVAPSGAVPPAPPAGKLAPFVPSETVSGGKTLSFPSDI